MSSKEKVYDAFAELIYAVVIADGRITQKEEEVISKIIKGHSIKLDIKKYFDSKARNISIAQSFMNTFEVCKQHGEDLEYPFLLKILKDIASVSEGLNNDEGNLLAEFIDSFRKRFKLT